MAEGMTNGPIRVSSGRILFANSVVTVEDLPELLELLGKSPAAAAAREITRTSTEGFLKEVTKEMGRNMESLDVRRRSLEAELARREVVLLESRFRALDGKVLNFSLEKGKDYAEMSIGHPKGEEGLTIGMGAVKDPREIARARVLLGIEKGTPADHWLLACVEAMKEFQRLQKHLGSAKMHLRLNRKAPARGLWIGKARGSYPKARKGRGV